MNNLLEIKNLNKKLGNFKIENMSFDLPKGYIMGLIGRNGAGKTTTIKLLLNMLKKESGNIKIFGLDNIEAESKVKENIGIVFDSIFFVTEWNLDDIEKIFSTFYQTWDKEKYYEYLKRFELERKSKVKNLSKGMRMKLMLATALSHDAKLLILDEPTSGLDPVARDELLDILAEYIEDEEKGVIFSTHITSDLEKIADYITFIENGKIYFSGTKDNFMDSFKIIKGGLEQLKEIDNSRIIGIRKHNTGFEGMIRKEDIQEYKNLHIERVTIDDIIIYTDRGDRK